jgi:alpha-L-rhamnosidase
MSSVLVLAPTFEDHHSGLGIEQSNPRISWRFRLADGAASLNGWKQISYELQVALNDSTNFASYHVQSAQSILVPWPAQSLASQQLARVRVRCVGILSSGEEHPTGWSEIATLETAFLHQNAWRARFITSATRGPPVGPIGPLRFRKDFNLPARHGRASRARLYITALGIFDAYIDGQRVSDELLAPGWTSYRHRLTYRVIDVSHLLKQSESHTLCIEVSEGWYCGRLGFEGGHRYLYGDTLAVLAQLDVWTDPRSAPLSVCSDSSWSCANSAIERSEFYDGETYDAASEWQWTSPSTDLTAHQWESTREHCWPETTLVCAAMPPVRVTQELTPSKIFKSTSGKTIIDFGQNLVGKVLVRSMLVPRGQRVTFRHAEVMENGELGTRPLRQARAEDTYISSGQKCTNWTPAFTFHGFRYVQVDGWSPNESDIVALVMHTDMRRRGHFSCSNPWVNRLHENVVWSMRGNFVSIPTDCPQRDERLGWTGDIQAFTPTACFLYDTTSFLSSWLQDVMAEQLEDGKGGIPPFVVPILPLGSWPHMPAAVWDDVTVLTPMDVFNNCGDVAILERQLPSMRAWLDEAIDRGKDGLWNRDRWQLADWLDPNAPPDDPGASRTDFVLVADAYLVHVTRTMSNVCSRLGKLELAQKYAADAERLRGLFGDKYITPFGNLMSSTQTGLALAIQFGLYPDSDRLAVAAAELVKQVQYARFRISTGFAGTPVVCHALTLIGQAQLAYRMLLEKTCPSWLYPVTMGATTIWERWNSMLPDGSINPGEMTSFNHYALGSVANWLHQTVGGISPAEPGWRVIRVRPVPGGNLTHAKVSFDGPYGLIVCSWKLSNSQESGTWTFDMELIVPPNSTAIVTLPSELNQSLVATVEEKSSTYGSGKHLFACDWTPAVWPPRAKFSVDRGEDDRLTIADGDYDR